VSPGDGVFQGIDPERLACLMTALSGGVSRAQPLAESYLAQFGRLGLDTGSVRRLLADYAWASGQQPMLSRRHALASNQPPGTFKDGMTGQGAGTLTYATSAAAAKAGTAAAEKLAALLAAGDDSAAQQQLADLAEHVSDPDYMTAYTDWIKKHDQALIAIAQPAFETYFASQQAWFRSTETLWSSQQALHAHAWEWRSPTAPPHAPELNAGSTQEYSKLAYDLLQDAKASGHDVKIQGDSLLIYDAAKNTMGVYKWDGGVRSIYTLRNGAAQWAAKTGDPPAGWEVDFVAGNAEAQVDASASWFARAGRLMDSPASRVGGRALQVLGAAADVYTIVDPSSDALGGPETERGMAAANLGAMAIGELSGPAAGIIAANSVDWVPVAGEVVMVGTAAYFVGDLVYENREAIGHALSWAGHETVHIADDVGHGIASGVSHAWDSIFG
jgi:hypothetical protein